MLFEPRAISRVACLSAERRSGPALSCATPRQSAPSLKIDVVLGDHGHDQIRRLLRRQAEASSVISIVANLAAHPQNVPDAGEQRVGPRFGSGWKLQTIPNVAVAVSCRCRRDVGLISCGITCSRDSLRAQARLPPRRFRARHLSIASSAAKCSVRPAMTTAVYRSSPAMSVPLTQNTAPVLEFNCLYTQ